MHKLDSVITYLKGNLDNIETFYNDFFKKKYTDKTLCFSFPPISKDIKEIDTILDTSNSSLLSKALLDNIGIRNGLL